MKNVLWGAFTAMFVLSLTGCAELKQLRVENSQQKTRIEQLAQDGESCQVGLKTAQEQLKAKDAEIRRLMADVKDKDSALRSKETEIKARDVKVKEQSDEFRKMQDAMKKELDNKQVALKELEGKLTLTMVESILFDSGKADVKPEGIEALKKVADVLKGTTGQDIIVAGYTDNVQIVGKLAKTYATNWELSAARAISVVKILTDAGVDPKAVCAAGYGEYRPVADNDSPEGRAKNRRMEIVLMPKRK